MLPLRRYSLPFKSKAQMRKFAVLLKEGKISKADFDKWHAETKNPKRLPERVKKKKKKGFADGFKKVAGLSLRSEHKNPKGGLSAKGRSAYNKATGSKLKPGVKGAAVTPEKMRRKGSWAVRFYGRSELPPLKKPNGEPTRLALSASAWGEKVPTTVEEARAIAAKGRALLERYKKTKG